MKRELSAADREYLHRSCEASGVTVRVDPETAIKVARVLAHRAEGGRDAA